MDGTSDKRFIEEVEIRLSLEGVGGIFSLHDGPATGKPICLDDGAILLSKDVQRMMKIFHPDFFRDLLGLCEVADFQKGIVFYWSLHN